MNLYKYDFIKNYSFPFVIIILINSNYFFSLFLLYIYIYIFFFFFKILTDGFEILPNAFKFHLALEMSSWIGECLKQSNFVGNYICERGLCITWKVKYQKCHGLHEKWDIKYFNLGMHIWCMFGFEGTYAVRVGN